MDNKKMFRPIYRAVARYESIASKAWMAQWSVVSSLPRRALHLHIHVAFVAFSTKSCLQAVETRLGLSQARTHFLLTGPRFPRTGDDNGVEGTAI